MKMIPFPRCVFGKRIAKEQSSKIIYLTDEDGKSLLQCIRVTHIGEKCDPNIQVGTVLILNPERYGGSFDIKDDETEEIETFEIVDTDPEKNFVLGMLNEDA